MSNLLAFNMTFTTVTCNCGETFALRSGWHDHLKRQPTTFYCPRGCKLNYGGESDTEKLKAEIESLKRSRDWHQNNASSERAAREQTERRLSATKAVTTKLRKRVAHGVCPCCNRTFVNLQRHMEGKHPEFGTDSPDR